MLLNSWLSRLIPSRSPNPFRNTRHRRITRLRQVERLEDRTLLSAIYVDAEADPLRADGTAELPFTTIQDGLDAATSGDQVEVAAGDYSENILMKTGVTVIGDGADTTTITGRPDKYGVVLFDTVDTAGLSGFTIETTDPGHSRSRAVVFAGNTADTAVLERNIITESRYGVFVNSPARPSIINNTFDGNGDRQGIYIGNKPTDPTIVNNIIVGYGEAGIHVVGGRTAPVPIIEHNDLFRNRKNYLNYPSLTGIDGNVSVKPGFHDGHVEEFSLQSDSPLIDIGNPLFGNDPDGTLRDLGALPFDQKTNQATTWTFEIDQAYDVPFELFNVTTAGTVDIEITWTGSTTDLHAQLTGRRRNDLLDPTAAYAETIGNSPLSFSYDVTDDDLLRGPGWRIALDDLGDAAHDAVGTFTVTVPFTESTDEEFQAQKVSLRSGDLWPSQELQDEFLVDHAAAPITGQHGIVSFSETPDCLEVKDLQHAGIFRQSFLPGRHVFGWLAPQLDLDAYEVDGMVNWITPLDPEDKVEPDLLLGNYSAFDLDSSDPTSGNYSVNVDGSLVVSVQFAADTDESAISNILLATTNGAVQIGRSGWLAGIDPGSLLDLAAYDAVEWVGGPPVPHLDTNDTTRMTLGVDEDINGNGVLDPGEDRDADGVLDSIQQPTINSVSNTITYAGLTGNGVNVGIHESSAIDTTHNDLSLVGSVNAASSTGSHATHVAGIVAGTGTQSSSVDNLWNLNPAGAAFTAFQFRGMAPRAGLIGLGQMDTAVTGGVFDYAVLPPADVETAITNFGMDVSNHSHVFTTNGRYDFNNVNADQTINGDAGIPRRPQVFAADNNGRNAPQSAHGDQEALFSVTTEAKNTIVVGNWDANAGVLSFSSSLGPTYDGRIKPDVVAPGSSILSTATNQNEVKTISFVGGVPTQGSFTLTFGGQTTGAIAFNASTATISTALQALTSIGAGNVGVAGGPLPNTSAQVTFTGTLGNQNVGGMPSADTGLDAGINSNVSSSQGATANGYTQMSGTSMASPAVSGVIALVLEGWQNSYSTPLGTTIDDSPPLPATLRAILIQTADDIVMLNEDTDGDGTLDAGEDLDGDTFLDIGVRTSTSIDVDANSNPADGVQQGYVAATVGPDYMTGWGMVNAESAINLVLDSRDEHGIPTPNRIVQDSLQHLEVVEYEFAVDSDMIAAGDDVRVTLAWDDVAGAIQNVVSGATLVNDLDLVLVDPLGNSFYPWQLGHVIRNAADNVLATAAQTPGTFIDVDLPFRDEATIANSVDNRSISLTTTPAASNDYVPANAMMGTGVWVASKGRDHINNVEVVDIDNLNLTAGHWTLQVSGFDVQDGPQDFSVVGQPHPDLADLVAYSDDKVTIGSLGENLELDFTVENVGDDVSESAVQYEIRLSTDFELGADVILYTSANDAIGVLNPGDTQSVSTTVQITSSDVIDLLGAGATFDDLIENDVFLIVRVDSNDAVIAHGDVLENNETNIAFLQMAREADVVLVMDRSGSMSADVTVSNGVHSKLQVLQDSAGLFLELLRRDAGDRVAEVAFDATAEVVFGDTSDELVEYTTDNQGTATTAVDNLTDGGATNMTDALIEAWDLLTADGDSDRQKVLVLFSDGVPTTSTGLLPTDPRDLSTDDGDPIDLDSFEDAGIRIYSVGFGTEGEGGLAGIDVDLLEDLANVGDEGFYHVTGSALDLDKFFVNAVAGAIDSEVIIDPIGTVAAGDTVEATNVMINSEDSVVTFVMTWHSQTAQDIDIAVRTPSGLVVDNNNKLHFADRVSLTEDDTYQVLEIHLPLTVGGEEQHAGNWTVLVNNNGTSSVDYSVSAIAESTLRMDVDVDDPPGGADYFVPGDQIPFNVTLTGDDRVPLGYSDVSIIPIVPLVNINSLLAGGMISEAQLAAIPTESNGETLNDTQRMIMAYEANHGSISGLVMELDPISLTMEYDQAYPELFGQWTGTFDSTEIPGPYTFVIRADGCSDLCEPFSRETTRTINIFEEIEPLLTNIEIEMPGNDTVVVTVAPTNSDGTIYGPSLDDDDLVIGFGDELSGSGTFTNNLDGSYSVTLEIGDGQTTGDLEVWVHGTMLATQTVNMREAWLHIEGRPAKDFGEDAALNVSILGQANGVTGIALKPVDSPPWAGMNNELTGNDALWHLADGIIHIAATLNQGNGSSTTIDATMPADLPVGEYTVQLETTSGLGPIDRNVTYRVIGRGQDLPERVQLVDIRLETFESGQMDGNADWRSMGEQLVREVLELPLGERLTDTIRFEAAKVVLETIDMYDVRCADSFSSYHPGGAQLHSPENDTSCIRPDLEQDEFKPLLRAVNLAHIDARFVDEPAATTATGDEIDVTLGSGVSLRIGTVSTAGESQVEITEGDLDVPQYLRSKIHVVYDITTTAEFDSTDGIEISLAYEEGDFDSEDNVRLFHMEDGAWVDRTETLDTTNNTVTARTSSLSPFMMTETPDLSLSGSSVIEGDSGSTDLIFTASLSETSSIDVQANYQVVGGTATDGVDFTASSGTVTIPAGDLMGTFSFPVLGDTEMEGFETVWVLLEESVAATIVDSTAIGTILDDEHSITFDADTGVLELVLDAGGASEIRGVDGFVNLEINGIPDLSLEILAAARVTSIVVTGSAADDSIKLTQTSSADGFTLLNGVTINAGSGDDLVFASPADSKLNGSGGNDVLFGNAGNDTINGGGGEDFLSGGDGDDVLHGQGSSLDSLSGGAGDDTIDGGAGYDYLLESADVSFTVTDTSLAGLGNDTLVEIQLAQLYGGSSANVLDGTAFSGRLFFNGSGGNDILRGGPGADRMFGGSGRDLIQGNDGDDVLRGQGGNLDTLEGGNGNDKLNGGIGHDVLDGGLGDDRLTGDTGDDTMTGGVGLDEIYEKFDGDVTLIDSRMTGVLGYDSISGIETAYLKGGKSGNTIDAGGFSGQTTLIGSGGVDRLIGGTDDDLLVGRAGDDILFGGDGDDWLQGLRGNDLLIGGTGNDLLDGGTESDSLTGQAGNDLLYGRGGNDSVVGGEGRDILWGGDDDDVMVGDDGKNSTTDSADDDSIDGGRGADTVRGGGGGDSIADSISEIHESFELIADWIDY